MQDVIDLVNSFPLWEQALLLKRVLPTSQQDESLPTSQQQDESLPTSQQQDESLPMQPPQMAPELLAN
jgi:hypothetical protein